MAGYSIIMKEQKCPMGSQQSQMNQTELFNSNNFTLLLILDMHIYNPSDSWHVFAIKIQI